MERVRGRQAFAFYVGGVSLLFLAWLAEPSLRSEVTGGSAVAALYLLAALCCAVRLLSGPGRAGAAGWLALAVLMLASEGAVAVADRIAAGRTMGRIVPGPGCRRGSHDRAGLPLAARYQERPFRPRMCACRDRSDRPGRCAGNVHAGRDVACHRPSRRDGPRPRLLPVVLFDGSGRTPLRYIGSESCRMPAGGRSGGAAQNIAAGRPARPRASCQSVAASQPCTTPRKHSEADQSRIASPFSAAFTLALAKGSTGPWTINSVKESCIRQHKRREKAIVMMCTVGCAG